MDVTLARNLLLDVFDRAGEQFPALVEGLDEAALTWRPDPDANPIGWLAWHVTRVEDDHLADLGGVDQVWTSEGPGDGSWFARFGLPYGPGEHGYGHTSEQVAQFRASAEDLIGYHRAVTAMTRRVLDELSDYERVVDTSWDPPVTAASRLVSVVNEVNQHLGQIGYVRGMLP